jgi:hypothetical protein
VQVVKKHADRSTSNASTVAVLKWAVWAIGNLVQMNKKPSTNNNANFNFNPLSSSGSNGDLPAAAAGSTMSPLISQAQQNGSLEKDNVGRIVQAGGVEVLVALLHQKRFQAEGEVVQWTARALNNVCLKLRAGVLARLQQIKNNTCVIASVFHFFF